MCLKIFSLRKKIVSNRLSLKYFSPILLCYLPHPFSSLIQQILWFDCLFPGKGDNGQVRLHPFWKVKRRTVSRTWKYFPSQKSDVLTIQISAMKRRQTAYHNEGNYLLLPFSKVPGLLMIRNDKNILEGHFSFSQTGQWR